MKKKTVTAYITKIAFLGFGFYIAKGGHVQITVSKKSKRKMKEKIKGITKRNRPIKAKELADELRQYLRGWINYYKVADMKGYLRKIDKWMRRRIRMIY